MILDGGPCNIGVESTVVDGLVDPPIILRPGGVSIRMLRECLGWEGVKVGYKDHAEGEVPRAPGMKYRHYSPRARLALVQGQLDMELVKTHARGLLSIGILRTNTWTGDLFGGGREDAQAGDPIVTNDDMNGTTIVDSPKMFERKSVCHKCSSSAVISVAVPPARHSQIRLDERSDSQATEVWTIGLGKDTADIARGLFSALRELDQKAVEIIFVEGISDSEGDIAAAVMNRLRKAAEMEIKA